MHSEIPAPVFLMFLIQNDLVLINYHIVPIVILYFWYFCHFTHLGWLYKPTYTFCNPNFNLSVHTQLFIFLSVFSLLSPLSLTFLGAKHPPRMTTWRMRAKTLSSLQGKAAGARIWRLLVVPLFFTQQVFTFWFLNF